MASLKLNGDEIMMSKKEIKRSISQQGTHVSSTVKAKENTRCRLTSNNNNMKSCQESERQPSENTSEESNVLMFKTIMIWAMVCLPGNIFAFAIFYKHYHNHSMIGQQYENGTYPSNALSTLESTQIPLTELDDIKKKHITNSTLMVSLYLYIYTHTHTIFVLRTNDNI